MRSWFFMCEWHDRMSFWVPLKELKDSNPIEVAEYIITNGLQEEPAFCWWVRDVLHKQMHVISKLKKHYAWTMHKFGVELPHSIQAAFNIDKKMGTDYWFKVIRHELEKLQVVLEIDDTIDPQAIRLGAAHSEYVGYKEIRCHWVFDIKMDLTRRAHFVARGHTTDTPMSMTYSSVVSQDSICIALMLTSLNDLEVLSCDISKAYINAPCKE